VEPITYPPAYHAQRMTTPGEPQMTDRLITTALLAEKGACSSQVATFARLFPDGVVPTESLAREHAAVFDVTWAASNLLSAKARAAFTAAVKPARDVYTAALKPAGAAYDAALKPARDVYTAAVKQAGAAYAAACAAYTAAAVKQASDAYDAALKPASDAYTAAVKQVIDAYDAARAVAFVHAWLEDR
jgi:hypothetical protein